MPSPSSSHQGYDVLLDAPELSAAHEGHPPGMKTELEEVGLAAVEEYLQSFMGVGVRDSTFFLGHALYVGLLRAATATWCYPEKSLLERLEWADAIRQATGVPREMHEQAVKMAMKQNGRLLAQLSMAYDQARGGSGAVGPRDFPKENGYRLHRHRELSELRAMMERLQALPEYDGVLQVEVVSAEMEPQAVVQGNKSGAKMGRGMSCISRTGSKTVPAAENPYVVSWLSGNGGGPQHCQVQFSDVLIGVDERAEWNQELPTMEVTSSEAAIHFEVRNSLDAATTDRHARAVQTALSMSGTLSPDKLLGQIGLMVKDLETFHDGVEMDLKLYRGRASVAPRAPVPEYMEDIAGAMPRDRVLYDLPSNQVANVDMPPVGSLTLRIRYCSEVRGEMAILADAARTIKRPAIGSVGWLRPILNPHRPDESAICQEWVTVTQSMDLEPSQHMLSSKSSPNSKQQGSRNKQASQKMGSQGPHVTHVVDPRRRGGRGGRGGYGSMDAREDLMDLTATEGVHLEVEIRDMRLEGGESLDQYDPGQVYLRVACLIWRLGKAKAFARLPSVGLSCYKTLQEYQGLVEFVESRLLKGIVPPSQLMELLLEFGRLHRVRPETQRLAILQMVLENWQTNVAYLRGVEAAAQPLLKSWKEGLLTLTEMKWLKGLTGMVVAQCAPLLDEHYSRLPLAEAQKLLPKMLEVLQLMLLWKAEGAAAVELLLPHFQRAAALRLQGHLEGQERGAVTVDMLLATINTAIEDFETDKVLQTVLPSEYDFLRETSEMRYIILEACMHMLFAAESHEVVPMLGVVEQRLAVHHDQLLAAGLGALVDARKLLAAEDVFTTDADNHSLQLYDLSQLVQERLDSWLAHGISDLGTTLQRLLAKEDWKAPADKVPVALAVVELYRSVQSTFSPWCDHCLVSCPKDRAAALAATIHSGFSALNQQVIKAMDSVWQQELAATTTQTARSLLLDWGSPLSSAHAVPGPTAFGGIAPGMLPPPRVSPPRMPMSGGKSQEMGITPSMCVVMNSLRRMLMEQADLQSSLDDVMNSSSPPGAELLSPEGGGHCWLSLLVRDFDRGLRKDGAAARMPRVVADQGARRLYNPGWNGKLGLQRPPPSSTPSPPTSSSPSPPSSSGASGCGQVEDIARSGTLLLAQYERTLRERLLLHLEALLNDVAMQSQRAKLEKLAPDRRTQVAHSQGLVELMERTRGAIMEGVELPASKADLLEATWLSVVDTLQRLAIHQAKFRPISGEEAEILLSLLEDLHAVLSPAGEAADLPIDWGLWSSAYSYCGCVLRLCSRESHVMMELFESHRVMVDAGGEEGLGPLDGFEAMTSPRAARALQRGKMAASWETGAGMRQVSLLDLVRLMRVRMKTERELRRFVEVKLQQAATSAGVLQVLFGLPAREPLVCAVRCQLVGVAKAGSLHLAPPCLGFTTMLDSDLMSNCDTTLRLLLAEVADLGVDKEGAEVLAVRMMDGTTHRFHGFDGGKLSYLLRNLHETLHSQPCSGEALMKRVAELQQGELQELPDAGCGGALRSAPCHLSAVLRNKAGMMHIYADKVVYVGQSGEYWEAQLRHMEEMVQEKGPATSWVTIRMGAAQRWKANRFGFEDSLVAQKMVECVRGLIRTFKP